MISLDVDKYCDNCPDFEPEVIKMEGYRIAGGRYKTDTVVTCASENKCRSIYNYLKAEEKK